MQLAARFCSLATGSGKTSVPPILLLARSLRPSKQVIRTLQMFRAIGLMGAAALPAMLNNGYSKLGLFTFDFLFWTRSLF